MLSDVMAFMRCGRPTSARVTWRAPWGVSFRPRPGPSGFYVVLRGSCWLIPADGEPVPLSVGDLVFLPHSGPFGLADDPARPLIESDCGPHSELFTSASLTGTGTETVTLSCGYRIDPDRTHPILDALPKRDPPARDARHPSGTARRRRAAGRRDRQPAPRHGHRRVLPARHAAARTSCGPTSAPRTNPARCPAGPPPWPTPPSAAPSTPSTAPRPAAGRSSRSAPTRACRAPASPAVSPRWSGSRPWRT